MDGRGGEAGRWCFVGLVTCLPGLCAAIYITVSERNRSEGGGMFNGAGGERGGAFCRSNDEGKCEEFLLSEVAPKFCRVLDHTLTIIEDRI